MNTNKRLRKVGTNSILTLAFHFRNKGISEISSDVGLRGNIQWTIY